jgi:hypothetical protein
VRGAGKPAVTRGTKLTVAVALVVLIAAAVPATAAERVKSRVKITEIDVTVQPGADRYEVKGLVSSPERACEKRREVRLQHQFNPETVELIDTFKANRRGRWKVEFEHNNPQEIWAVIETKRTHGLKCLKDRSKRVEP